jgi:regulatory protein
VNTQPEPRPSRSTARDEDDASSGESRRSGSTGRYGRSAESRRSRDADKNNNPPADPVAQAREICLRLLTMRPRSRAELHTALLGKGIEADVADRVLGRLNEVGLVDDASFAEQWVRSRHTHQGMARRALAAELRRKGVEDPIAAEAIAAVDSESEEARARELVRKRLRALTTVDELTKIRRLVAMLARKGYSEGMAYRVARDELRTAGIETEEYIPDPD